MCNDINDVSGCALKLVQLLQLGKLESGSITLASKHNSRNGRWFSQKSKTNDNSEGGAQNLFVTHPTYHLTWEKKIPLFEFKIT